MMVTFFCSRRCVPGEYDRGHLRLALLLRGTAGPCRAPIGSPVARRQVGRLIQVPGRRAIAHRNNRRRHRRAPAVREDLVYPSSPLLGRKCCGAPDTTEHCTRAGTLYRCGAECVPRQVVGWSIADRIRSDLIVDALPMATWRRRPRRGTTVHAERGSRYTSWVLGHKMREAGLLEMGSIASNVDNSMIGSFWSTMQRELLDTRLAWDSPEELGAAIFEWIEAWYNPRRPRCHGRLRVGEEHGDPGRAHWKLVGTGDQER
jgi:putative transposase